MPVRALTQIDSNLFFNPQSTDSTRLQRLNTQVGGVAASNDLSSRLSVTTAEGDTITLTADLEYDFRAVNYKSLIETDQTTVKLEARYTESTLKKEFGLTVLGDLNEQKLKDLEGLFRRVSNIFHKFVYGLDDAALAKTARLAERFGQMSSLSGLDLSVDVGRSVTALAAQIVSEATGQASLPAGQEFHDLAATASKVTSGGAPPAAAVVIPQPSTGTTSPHPSAVESAAGIRDGIYVSESAQDLPGFLALVQQILDALRDATTESHKVRKYLPDFFERLREDLTRELRGVRKPEEENREYPMNPVPTPTANSNLVVAYRTVSQTSISSSIQN